MFTRQCANKVAFKRQAEFVVPGSTGSAMLVAVSERHGTVFISTKRQVRAISVAALEAQFDGGDNSQPLPLVDALHDVDGDVKCLCISVSCSFLAVLCAEVVLVYKTDDVLLKVCVFTITLMFCSV